MAYREADVFLVCYKVTDIASLFSAINMWVPELRARAPVTPIVVCGLQADLRGDRATIHSLARQGRAPVSPDQARSFSQQIEAVTYVETSAKLSSRGPEAIFQLAAQISMEQVREQATNSVSPASSLERKAESPELFDASFFRISAAEAIAMDPQQRLVLEYSYLASQDAGYGKDDLAGTNCGVFLGIEQNDAMLLSSRQCCISCLAHTPAQQPRP